MKLAKRIVGMFVITTFVVSFAGCSLLAGDPKNTKSPDEILADAKKEIVENMKADIAKNADTVKDQNPFAIFDKPTSEGSLNINLESGEEGKVAIALKATKKKDVKKMNVANPTYLDLILKTASESNISLDLNVDDKGNKMAVNADIDTLMNEGVFYAKLNDLKLPSEGPGAMPADQMKMVMDMYAKKWFKVDFAQLISENEMIKQMLAERVAGMDLEKSVKIVEAYLDEVLAKNDFFEVDEDSKKVTRAGAVYDLKISAANVKILAEAHLDYLIKNWDDMQAASFSTITWTPQMKQGVKTQLQFVRDNLKETDFSDIVIKGTFANDKLKELAYVYKADNDNEVGALEFKLTFEDDKHDLNYAHATFDVGITPKGKKGKLTFDAKLNMPKNGKRMTSMNFDLKARETDSNAADAKFNMEMAMDQDATSPDYIDFGLQVLPPKDDSSGIKALDVKFSAKGDKITGSLVTTPKEKINITFDATVTDSSINGEVKLDVNMSETEKAKGSITLDYKASDEAYTFALPADAEEATDMTDTARQAMQGLMYGLAMGMAGGMQPPMMQPGMPVDVLDMQETK